MSVSKTFFSIVDKEVDSDAENSIIRITVQLKASREMLCNDVDLIDLITFPSLSMTQCWLGVSISEKISVFNFHILRSTDASKIS